MSEGPVELPDDKPRAEVGLIPNGVNRPNLANIELKEKAFKEQMANPL